MPEALRNSLLHYQPALSTRSMVSGMKTLFRDSGLQPCQRPEEPLQICRLSCAGRTEKISAGAEQASRISAIKELFPDYGDGFLAECLSAFGQKPERVINALLEGSLPPQLSSLDPSMPLRAPTQTSRGKGKHATEGVIASCAKLC